MQVDFPPLGIGDPAFTRMAPSSEVGYWSAVQVSENTSNRRYFIGGGFADLNWTFESEDGRSVVRCENGFVYVFFSGDVVLTVPCRNRGYLEVVSEGHRVAFWNYSELVLIDPQNGCRYGGDIAIDDLVVTGISDEGVYVEGRFCHGGALEARFVAKNDLGLIEVPII